MCSDLDLGFWVDSYCLSTFTLLQQHITLKARHPALHTDDADVSRNIVIFSVVFCSIIMIYF